MNPRRTVSVLFAVLAATMLVTGSFGFTSVSADRGVSINVVDSENAYVGVSVCEKSNGNGNENGNGANPVRVTVTNQFSDSFTVEKIAAGDSAHSSEKEKQFGRSIDSGDRDTFNAFGDEVVTVVVTDGLDATVTVEVEEKSTCNTNGTNSSDEDDNDEEEE
ncbi:hypothetical protein B4589_001665 [Halolamina sp. CBA1230]|uniref:hypothetical protein n=1 Tax=Halolamina sp. CBA1230 TaxID=1853690 RepID=UPI0009A1A6A9|nr:hypothetical protein [Halolamina sp. CBA1230]QKY19146.1 hypothetical protein B4589_001665 [Halolamina sp. CBA1230]